MSRNYGREAAGEVGGTLFPVIIASGPLLGFCGFVCVLGLIVIGIYGAFAAVLGSAEQLDAYIQTRSSGLLLSVLLLPSLVALPVASRLIGGRWTPSFRKTKILALLLAATWLVVTTISTINGSQIWAQLAYHWDEANAGRSLILAQNCPLEVAKPGYDRVAHDPKFRYRLFECDRYLSPTQVVDACWREYRTMKPIHFTVCGWKRRELTGLNWPIKNPVVIPGEPREVFATEAEMRAVLASKGLSPL